MFVCNISHHLQRPPAVKPALLPGHILPYRKCERHCHHFQCRNWCPPTLGRAACSSFFFARSESCAGKGVDTNSVPVREACTHSYIDLQQWQAVLSALSLLQVAGAIVHQHPTSHVSGSGKYIWERGQGGRGYMRYAGWLFNLVQNTTAQHIIV